MDYLHLKSYDQLNPTGDNVFLPCRGKKKMLVELDFRAGLQKRELQGIYIILFSF